MSNRPTRDTPAAPVPADPNDHADGAAIGDATRHLARAVKRIEAARGMALESKRGNWRLAGNAYTEIESAAQSLARACTALHAATGSRL